MNDPLEQLSIPFDPKKKVRSAGPDTSRAAARQAESVAAGHWRKILEHLRSIWPAGAIKDDIAGATGIPSVSVARRMRELADNGAVVDSEERRPTPSGRQAIVWKWNDFHAHDEGRNL